MKSYRRNTADRLIPIINTYLRIPLDSYQTMRGVEVGVFRGHTSHGLLRAFPGLHLSLIDPYLNHMMGNRTPFTVEQAEVEAHEATEFAANRREFIKTPSPEAAILFPNESLDFVFIDGNHHYEHVRQDVRAWWPKVRQGGILLGHDYNGVLDRSGKYGVKLAVDEFAREIGRQVIKLGHLFWGILKP